MEKRNEWKKLNKLKNLESPGAHNVPELAR
jgi:hypothetical protein